MSKRFTVFRNRYSEMIICVLIIFAILIAFLTIEYSDIVNTLDNSMLLVSAVKHERIRNYYEFTLEYGSTEYPANYNFPVYVLFALWNVPSLIICRALGTDYLTAPLAHLWCKLLPVLFLTGCAALIFKIVLIATSDRKRAFLSVTLFLSSLYVYDSVFICTQIDSISLFFMLLGLRLRQNGREWGFLLCFTIAIPFKLFAILLLIPLILLREKRPAGVLLRLLIPIAPLVAEKVFFKYDGVYSSALTAQNSDAFKQLMGNGIPVFPACYVILLAICYQYQEDTEPIPLFKADCFAAAFLFGTFSCFATINVYWVVYMVPFLIICMFICKNSHTINTTAALETLGGISFSIWAALAAPPLRSHSLFTDLLLPSFIRMPDKPRFGSIHALALAYGMGSLERFLWSVHVACVLTILCLCLYDCIRMNSTMNKEAQESTEIAFWLYLRSVMMTAVIIFMIIAAVCPSHMVLVFNNHSAEPQNEINLIEGDGHILQQQFNVGRSGQAHEMGLQFLNPHQSRNNFCRIRIEIINEHGEQLYCGLLACNEINSQKTQVLKLPKILLQEGKRYILQLTGLPGSAMDRYWGRRLLPYLYRTDSEEGRAKLDGDVLEYALSFEIR